MWANREAAALAEWLRAYNETLPADERVGFYGLDVYSLWDSMAAVVEYLETVDPALARAAKAAYLCFEPYGEDAQAYARATVLVPTTCEDEAAASRGGHARKPIPAGSSRLFFLFLFSRAVVHGGRPGNRIARIGRFLRCNSRWKIKFIRPRIGVDRVVAQRPSILLFSVLVLLCGRGIGFLTGTVIYGICDFLLLLISRRYGRIGGGFGDFGHL